MFDYLISKAYECFGQIPDHRKTGNGHPLPEALMGGLAVFSLKDPSLLSFVENFEARRENLRNIFKINEVPTDNGLRKVLDPVDPAVLLPCFQSLHGDARVKVAVEGHRCFETLGGYTAIAADGTEHFCSSHTNCPHCLVRKLKNGEAQHYHQMVAACIVKPYGKTVFPVFAEPITRRDGATKNDCEYNAFKRLAPRIAQVLPDCRKLILLDGLFADGPATRAVLDNGMDFITVVKEGYVLVQADRLGANGQLQGTEWAKGKHFRCSAKWANGLLLNGANQDIKVNYLHFVEVDTRTGKKTYEGKWISSIGITGDIVPEFASVARSKWKIENETFNVLKNHGYNLGHNYGHGKRFLSSLFATLMFLAFLADQLTLAADGLFQKALAEAKTMRDFRQKVRVLFDYIPCLSMNVIYGVIARKFKLGLSP